jgi:hypothetical protein
MLDIGKNNLFISTNTGMYIVSRMIGNYDLMGLNCLYLDRTSVINLNCNVVDYCRYDEIPKILENNLFRVNIIIIEVSKNFGIALQMVREVTDLPLILIGKDINDFYKLDNFDYIYEMYREKDDTFIFDTENYEENFLNNSYIKDVKNDSVSSLKNLETEYIRDKKLELILKNK